MRRHRRGGFTLIEVLAAFAVTMILIVPIVGIIHGAAGSFAGLERSTGRRVGMQAAMAAAMTVNPLRPGTVSIGEFKVTIARHEFDRSDDLARAGWQLYAVSVSESTGARDTIIETVRLGISQ